MIALSHVFTLNSINLVGDKVTAGVRLSHIVETGLEKGITSFNTKGQCVKLGRQGSTELLPEISQCEKVRKTKITENKWVLQLFLTLS
jgi:hypothetical protein